MPTDVLWQLVSASICDCGLALVAFVSLFVFRLRGSAARHAVWTVVLIGMLVQIPLRAVAPPVLMEVLPPPSPTQPRVAEPARTSMSPAQALAPTSHTRWPVTFRRTSWSVTLTRIYVAASLLLFLRMAFGYWGVHKILRDSTSIPKLGPNLFESTQVVVPGSAGCLRGKILLPKEWRGWDAAKLGAVLAHEKAHLERHDCLTQLVSQINTCIFWFHPLAWWMRRELARLAEEACDDVAVFETKDKEEYAATLVDIAHRAAASGGVLRRPVISMASPANVTRRVHRILERTFQVSKPLGGLARAALLVWSLPVIYMSAAVNFAPARAESITLKHAPIPILSAGLLGDVVSNHNQSSPAPPVQSQPDERPLAICILLDSSGSMDKKRAEAMAAALAVVKASKPHDEICIIQFDDEVFNSLPNDEDFTSNIEEMEEAISRIDARGGKAMRDAVQTGIDHLGLTRNERKVLVLITEGYDTSSKVTREALLGRVKSSRVPVYCVGLLSESDSQRRDAARLTLGQLADESGGLAFYPKNVEEVEHISRQIANEASKR